MIIEAGEAVPWTRPADLAYRPDQPLPPVGGIFTTKRRFSLFGSNRVKGFHAAFADGSTRWLPTDLPEAELRAMIERSKLR
ncbi:MAG TPA: hypothetical protein VGY66_23070 [Gemmataceae bacterium]|jgi:hypothetical protein|nr:hypothetical protein [Gemmataceae bacterium]